MMERQRVLLYLIRLLQKNGSYSRTKLDKLLFLLAKEYNFGKRLSFYSFYPYKYGPFSQLFYYDLRRFGEEGYLEDEEITDKALREIDKIKTRLIKDIETVSGRFSTLNELKEYVYSSYPEYTIRSELVKERKVDHTPQFFSIGYEGKNIDGFLDMLIQNNIELVADVRYNPFSMQFTYTKNKLVEYLKKVDIGYLHFPELGIPGKYRKQLEKLSDYRKLFEFYEKNILKMDNLARLIGNGRKRRTAILCMESDHGYCHRGVIASQLEGLGFGVKHL